MSLAAWSKRSLGTVPARLLCLLRARLVATASGARASRLQSRPFPRLLNHSGLGSGCVTPCVRRGATLYIGCVHPQPHSLPASEPHSLPDPPSPHLALTLTRFPDLPPTIAARFVLRGLALQEPNSTQAENRSTGRLVTGQPARVCHSRLNTPVSVSLPRRRRLPATATCCSCALGPPCCARMARCSMPHRAQTPD